MRATSVLLRILLLVSLAMPSFASAQSLADYTAAAPFLSMGLQNGETETDCRVHKQEPAVPAARNFSAAVQSLEPREATNRYKQRLLSALNSLTPRSASGTSAAVMAAPTGGGALYHAFFYPLLYEGDRAIKWTGYTQGLFMDPYNNLREDSDGDGRLVLEYDYIVRTRFDSATRDLLVDRYQDADGNGVVDNPYPFQTVGLRDLHPLWEAGKRLAFMDPRERRLLTWVDQDHDGLVSSAETITFDVDNETTLAPYLRSGPEPYSAGNFIRFIRGEQVPKLRDREVMVAEGGGAGTHVWKLGDSMHSSPVVVGAPKERYDVIYGDTSYAEFFRRYRQRRQVLYVGANDGMLHAFNAGFYHHGDDAATEKVEHGWFTQTPDGKGGAMVLGRELWGFIPYQLLPHLQWLARTDYAHAYYVDLKPKVTDVRIFTPDEEHPGGWGTILIGGFRMGGSCSTCQGNTGATPMTVRADFGAGVQSRTFYSAYFVLDITNPERDPVLLWSFSEPSLGLTTSAPAVVRVGSLAVDGTVAGRGTRPRKSDVDEERWVMVVGSGPTAYDGTSQQTGKLFAIDLRTGPLDPSGSNLVMTFPTSEAKSFLGDVTAVDTNLDYRVDVLYVGSAVHHGKDPSWTGRLYRLITRGQSDVRTWGIPDGADQIPTVVLETLPPRIMAQPDLLATDELDLAEAPVTYGFVGDDLQALVIQIQEDRIGPITSAPTVSVDEQGKAWVFVGTGRFYGSLDKADADPQHLFGLKDPVVTGECLEYNAATCQQRNLLNVTDASICWRCPAGPGHVSGVVGATTFDGLLEKVRDMDGWYLPLSSPRERSLTSASLVGGVLLFASFIPNNSLCGASGHGYVLYYATGTAYKTPLFATHAPPTNDVPRKVTLGQAGMVSRAAVVLGQDTPVKTARAVMIPSAPCQSSTVGYFQSSFGPLTEICAHPPLSTGSRYLSWLNNRN
jgi:type IV pilus assembly protein PilY1